MNEVKDQPEAITSEILIKVHFTDGDTFHQPFPVDWADSVQEFMDWFRRPGKRKTWAWHVITDGHIHMFRHEHIMAVDIEGYWEPDGRRSRWYERWMDKLRAKMIQK
jgi:hypothetical protein